MIYLQGGHRQRQTHSGRGWESALGKRTSKAQVKVPNARGSRTEASVNDYSESTIKLSLFCSVLSCNNSAGVSEDVPCPWAVWLRLKRFYIQRSWALLCPRNVGRGRGGDVTLGHPLHNGLYGGREHLLEHTHIKTNERGSLGLQLHHPARTCQKPHVLKFILNV